MEDKNTGLIIALCMTLVLLASYMLEVRDHWLIQKSFFQPYFHWEHAKGSLHDSFRILLMVLFATLKMFTKVVKKYECWIWNLIQPGCM